MFIDLNGDGNYGTYDPSNGLFIPDSGEYITDTRVANFQGFQTGAGTLSAGDISGWYTVSEPPTGTLAALGLSEDFASLSICLSCRSSWTPYPASLVKRGIADRDDGVEIVVFDRNMGIWETVAAMKTTIELPDTLYRRVKSKSSLDGQPIRAVTQRLYELWLDGVVSLSDEKGPNPEGKNAWAAKWVRETEELSDQISAKTVEKRLGRDILKDDRR